MTRDQIRNRRMGERGIAAVDSLAGEGGQKEDMIPKVTPSAAPSPKMESEETNKLAEMKFINDLVCCHYEDFKARGHKEDAASLTVAAVFLKGVAVVVSAIRGDK